MSNKFTRLTIDLMHDDADNANILDYLSQLVETVDEEAEYLEIFTVVSATTMRVELKEVGPAFSIHTPKPTSADVISADEAEVDEPVDQFADELDHLD